LVAFAGFGQPDSPVGSSDAAPSSTAIDLFWARLEGAQKGDTIPPQGRKQEMSSTMLTLIGGVALNVVLIFGIHRLFPRRSRSGEDDAISEADREWPELADKLAAAWLVVVKGVGKGARYMVTGGTTIIGRGSSCDIALADQGVSRQHARIVKRGDQFLIYDLESTNGTSVDGTMVEPRQGTPLRYGSVVSIGETTLVLNEPWQDKHTS
jgi:hypothetical protein